MNGEASVTFPPPLTIVPAVLWPLLRSNHSVEKFCCAVERSIMTEPPEGKYTRYSAGLTKQ